MPEFKKIGFIGTGIMGSVMAMHLINFGFELSVYNRTKTKAQKLIDKGAKWCETIGDCVCDRDVVITMVGYPKDVEEIYLSPNGIISFAKKGTYLVDMTTSSPPLAEKIFNVAKTNKLHAIDAPVTGGDIGARNATLTIFVGGDEEDFKKLQSIFKVLGTNIVYEGSAGSGQKSKICNQIAIAGILAGACEAFAYAKASGLELEKIYSTISKGSAESFQMSNVIRKGLDGNFKPGFMIQHFKKDLAISFETAKLYGVSLPILEVVLQEIQQLESAGNGKLGTQALLKHYAVKD